MHLTEFSDQACRVNLMRRYTVGVELGVLCEFGEQVCRVNLVSRYTVDCL